MEKIYGPVDQKTKIDRFMKKKNSGSKNGKSKGKRDDGVEFSSDRNGSSKNKTTSSKSQNEEQVFNVVDSPCN